MDLLRQLLLTKLVECKELLSQDDVFNKSTAGQLDPDDHLTVRNHHRHVPELDLHVLRKLLSAFVSGILKKIK